MACLKGYYKVVEKLLDRGEPADSDETNITLGTTPLIAACINGHVDIVELVLNRSAKVNLQNNDGWSALMVASQNGHNVVVKLLIDKGAEVNMQNNKGWSALMIACYHGRLETVRLLIENHADTSLQDIDGTTALGLACRKGHDEIVDILYRVKEQAEMDNSRASIQDESSGIRSVRNTEDTNDHTMNERIDLSGAAIQPGCHGNNHKQRIKPVTTERQTKMEQVKILVSYTVALIWTKFYDYYSIHTPLAPDAPELSQLKLQKELKIVTDPLQLGIGSETIEKENKQGRYNENSKYCVHILHYTLNIVTNVNFSNYNIRFFFLADASGPLSGPHRHRDRLSTVDGDSSSHPANGGHRGQPQLLGTSSCGTADSKHTRQ